jgi:cytoskeletal protein CcmA (bactofilin family)
MTADKKSNNVSTAMPSVMTDEATRLVVGRAMALRGDIAACHHMIVEGAVESHNFSAQRLDVADSGHFTGIAHVQKATIAGRFDGQLTVDGLLHVKSTAVITGEIRYAQLQVESGAALTGHMICTVKAAPQTAANEGDAQKRVLNVESIFKSARNGALRNDIPRGPRKAKAE